MSAATTWVGRRLTLGVFLAALLFGLSIDRQVPWTDDARFYVPAAAAYGRWLESALAGVSRADLTPFSQARLDEAFAVNREHPPVAKYVMAAGWLLAYRWTGLLEEVAACRLGVVLLWALMVTLTFAWVRRIAGVGAAGFAAGALVFLPRLLFDGQVETLDAPVAALLTLTGALLFVHLEEPKLVTGVGAVLAFGLALGTKLNAPFFLLAAVLYLLILRPPRREHTLLASAPIPWVFLGLTLVSPLLVWLSWPWLWFDTSARLAAYAQYHLHHYGIFFYYRGQLFGDEVAPWPAPWVMLAVTTPVTTQLLALVGAATPTLAALARVPRIARRFPNLPDLDTEGANRLGLFALLQVVTQLGAVSLPGVPVYGGVKLFLPAFPFLAILAGLGFARVLASSRALALSARGRLWLGRATAAGLMLPAAIAVVAYRGAWLSYYNEPTGGVRGGVAAGFERQYYDLAYPRLATDLNALFPDGGRVAVLPNPKEYGPHLERWQRLGALSPKVSLVPVERADLLVLTHERRWRDYPELFARYRSRPVRASFTVAGVPLYTVLDLRPGARASP